MPLHIISDDEELTGRGHYYIKAKAMTEVKEIHFEIMNNKPILKTFYGSFDKNVKRFDVLFHHLNDMTPAERRIVISKLPPIPAFLHGCDMITIKVNYDQYNSIGAISKLVNTTLSNMMLIIYYVSIPPNLYNEFPYLGNHYRFIEMYLNCYLRQTNGNERLSEYETIKNFF
jgi:hypothetical protein